jgi:hypothetical protein
MINNSLAWLQDRIGKGGRFIYKKLSIAKVAVASLDNPSFAKKVNLL